MKTLVLAAVSMITGAAFADEIAPPPKATTLMTRDLEGIAGKEMLVLTVEYPPGGVSPPHRHDASVFVYVLEGAVTMQVSGSAPVTLAPRMRAGSTVSRVRVTSQVASRRSAYLRFSIGRLASAASIASSAAQSTWGATPRPSQLVPVTESVQYPTGSSLVTVAASRISVT